MVVGILELHIQPVGLIGDVGCFHTVHQIVFADGLLMTVGDTQVTGKAAYVGAKSQLRTFEYGYSAIDNLILSVTVIAKHVHLKFSVG